MHTFMCIPFSLPHIKPISLPFPTIPFTLRPTVLAAFRMDDVSVSHRVIALSPPFFIFKEFDARRKILFISFLPALPFFPSRHTMNCVGGVITKHYKSVTLVWHCLYNVSCFITYCPSSVFVNFSDG